MLFYYLIIYIYGIINMKGVEMEKNNKFSAVLITAIVLVLLFGGVLFIFNKQGYLSFKKDKCVSEIGSNTKKDDCITKIDDDNNKNNANLVTDIADDDFKSLWKKLTDDDFSFKNDISTTEEFYNIWEKAAGYWVNVDEKSYNGDWCNGSFLRLNNTNYDGITFGKFNSEYYFGNILSVEKIANNKYMFYMVIPSRLGYENAYFYNRVIDTSEVNKKVLKFAFCEDCDYDTYKYVAKDIDFGNDDMTTYFCKWYKNH